MKWKMMAIRTIYLKGMIRMILSELKVIFKQLKGHSITTTSH